MLNDNDKEVLVSIYYDTDYVQKKKPNHRMSQYVSWTKHHNPVQSTHYSVKLTGIGKEWVELFLRCKGRPTGPRRGIAMEERLWREIDEIQFTGQEIADAFLSISKKGEVRCEVMTDSWGRIRIACNDIEMAIARIAYEIKWEMSGRNPEILSDFSEAEKWLWCYLDSIKSRLTNTAFQQEFIVWDDFFQVPKCQG